SANDATACKAASRRGKGYWVRWTGRPTNNFVQHPPSPCPSPPGRGNSHCAGQFVPQRLSCRQSYFREETEDDSPSPGGEGRGEGGPASSAKQWALRASAAVVLPMAKLHIQLLCSPTMET